MRVSDCSDLMLALHKLTSRCFVSSVFMFGIRMLPSIYFETNTTVKNLKLNKFAKPYF